MSNPDVNRSEVTYLIKRLSYIILALSRSMIIDLDDAIDVSLSVKTVCVCVCVCSVPKPYILYLYVLTAIQICFIPVLLIMI